MNTLEPVIAFIDERMKQLKRASSWPATDARDARIQELEMIRNLCTGLIEQDRLLQKALAV